MRQGSERDKDEDGQQVRESSVTHHVELHSLQWTPLAALVKAGSPRHQPAHTQALRVRAGVRARSRTGPHRRLFLADDGGQRAAATPAWHATPVPPMPQYPPGFLARYCW
jgi:hypothetical protein